MAAVARAAVGGRAASVAAHRRAARPYAVAVAASLAAAVAGVLVTSGRPVGGAMVRLATTLRVADILSAPRGVVTLPDGRQLRARTVAVGGCAVSEKAATVKRLSVNQGSVVRAEAVLQKSSSLEAAPATEEEATKVEAAPAPTKTLSSLTAGERACMASTPDGLVCKGFEGVVVGANGFRFSAGVTIKDVDADAGASEGAGWAETMSTVGRAGGEPVVSALVAPLGY